MSSQAVEAVVDLATSVYSLAAIKKAAYRFGDRCHVHLEPTADGWVRVRLRPKRLLDSPTFLSAEFQNEVLDQDLLEAIARETEGVRNLLLAQAFSATSLLDSQGETAAYQADPECVRLSDGNGRDQRNG
jgi:His-Xaa-Ser system protein HxsD